MKGQGSNPDLATNNPLTLLCAQIHFLGFIRDMATPFEGRKEGNVLFNDALNTFYLRSYGVRHMVKDHSDSERGNPLLPYRLLLTLTARVLLYAPSQTG